MSDPVNISMPCGGDAFEADTRLSVTIACSHCAKASHLSGKCTGPGGWPILAHTAAEVARERIERLEREGKWLSQALKEGDGVYRP